MKKKQNFLKRMWAGIWMVISRPKYFFSRIVADGNIEDAMLKAFFYGMVGGLAVLLMQLIGGATVTFGSVFSKLIIVPVLAVTLLFVFGGLLMLISEITGGERDWEISLKGLASIFFFYPVILVLNQLAWGCWSLLTISILVDIYVLFLLYNLAVYCIRGTRGRVLVVIGAMAVLLLTVYLTDYRIGWLMMKNSVAALNCVL
jgi:hypothetical protein